MNRKQKLITFLILLSLVNVFLSHSIIKQKEFNDSASLDTCFAQNQGCYDVQVSEYASLFGISLPAYGIVAFLSLTVLLSMLLIISIKKEKTELYKHKDKIKNIIKIMMFVGLISSIYLIYLQKYVISSFCEYCLAVDGIMVFMAAAYLLILH